MIDKRTFLPRLAVLGGLAFSLPVYAQYSSPTRDVDNGARQPVNFTAGLAVNNGSSGNTNTTAVTIPAGKRLVIETISSNGLVPSGELGLVSITVTSGAGTAAGATSTTHTIPVVKITSTGGGDFIGGIGAFRMYADAGSTVTIHYERGGFSGSGGVSVNITGHYVNLP